MREPPPAGIAGSVDVPGPTERLVFRWWTEADLPLAAAIWGDARVMARVGGALDPDGVRARLLAEVATHRSRGYQYWPMFSADRPSQDPSSGSPTADRAGGRSEGDKAHVGCCGLKPADEPGAVELGYYLRPEHWGRGIAREAAGAVVAYAFDRLGVVRITAGHHPENHASGKVLVGLGFAYTHRALYPPTGLEHPNYRLDRRVRPSRPSHGA